MTIAKRVHAIFLFAALGAVSDASLAGTALSSFNVTATVASNCLITSTAMVFGTYDPLAVTDNVSSSIITVKCTKNKVVTIGLDGGSSANDTNRSMTLSGNDPLPYGLYSDSARLVNWGATTGAQTTTGTGLNTGVNVPVYGKIPAHQYTAGEGNYSDTVIATVSF